MKDLSQLDLFSTKSELRIAKITTDDVVKDSDKLKMFKNLVAENEQMYPNIKQWLRYKVFPGIKNNERTAYLGLNNEEPIITAILKKGRFSKICHLKISEEFKKQGLGELFFAMMAIDIRNSAEETHFTLPESLWNNDKEFFKSFGFREAIRTLKQYRTFEQELRCSVSFKEFWERTLYKLPNIINSFTPSNINIFNGLLMSIKPEYIKKMENGEKVVEIRKKFNPRWKGCRVTLYSSTPTQALYGYAVIKKIDRGSPDYIWEKYKKDIGSDRDNFVKYANNSNRVYAIHLDNYETYLSPLFLEQISHLTKKDLKPPQSYFSLENNSDWAQAVSIAELLHGRFQIYSSVI